MPKTTVRKMTAQLDLMHQYCRPAGSVTDNAFRKRWLMVLPNATLDAHANIHVPVPNPDGTPSTILWSAHTDTVHKESGFQTTELSPSGMLRSLKSNCLGADDTAGVWLLRELIKAKVPGHYIFHYGEERGCVGSRALAASSREWLQQFTTALAFDRKGQHEIITHQCGSRTASDTWADAFAAEVNGAKGSKLALSASPEGVYTDTESYADIIPECTNIAVGYTAQHTQAETLDVPYLLHLREVMLQVGPRMHTLPISRDPSVVEKDDWNCGWPLWTPTRTTSTRGLTLANTKGNWYLEYTCLGCDRVWTERSDYMDDQSYCTSCLDIVDPDEVYDETGQRVDEDYALELDQLVVGVDPDDRWDYTTPAVKLTPSMVKD